MVLEGEPIVQFIGLNELTPEEQEIVRTLSTEYQDKIQKEMETPTSLIVDIRAHEEEGHRKKYSVHIRTMAAASTMHIEKASDWDLERTLHKAFKNMERLILHKTHVDSQHKRVY
jgi:hypothetical protein